MHYRHGRQKLLHGHFVPAYCCLSVITHFVGLSSSSSTSPAVRLCPPLDCMPPDVLTFAGFLPLLAEVAVVVCVKQFRVKLQVLVLCGISQLSQAMREPYCFCAGLLGFMPEGSSPDDA